MDIRTWQEAGVGAGSYSARHRARSPFSPLRPAPIAIGSLSTAAIAAFAFVAPGILHGTPAGAGIPLLDGAPNRMAPLSPGGGGNGDPGHVSVTAPSSAAATSDDTGTPTSSASSEAPVSTSSSSPTPLTIRTTATSPTPPRPTQPQPSQPPTPTSSPSQSPTSPTSDPSSPSSPTTTNPTFPGYDSSAAASSALSEIGGARSRQGVSRLSVDSLLTTAARVHSEDMARTGDFSHIGSDGSDPFSRAADLGCFTLSQELIAHGKPGDDVIGALLQDPASRRALLAYWNTSIGISAQLDPDTGDVYWTVELGWG